MTPKIFLSNLFILCILIEVSFCSQLEYVLRLMRYGTKAPTTYNMDTYWKGKQNTLLDIGKAQQLILGAQFGLEYLQKNGLSLKGAELESIDEPYAIESLKYFFYGARSYQSYKEDLSLDLEDLREISKHKVPKEDSIQLSNIKTRPREEDFEFRAAEKRTCARIEALLEKEYQIELEMFAEEQSMKISQFMPGTQISSSIFQSIYETGMANLNEGRHLPLNLDYFHEVWDLIKNTAEYFYYKSRLGNAEQVNVASSLLLKRVANQLRNRIEGKSEVEVSLFVVHESTILSLLSSLEVIYPDCMKEGGDGLCHFPEFGSRVDFEVWEKDGKKYLRILYDGREISMRGIGSEYVDLEMAVQLFDLKARYSHSEVKNECKQRIDDEL